MNSLTPDFLKHLATSRRDFIKRASAIGLTSGLIGLPALRPLNAAPAGVAERVIFFYFPNGVAPNAWFPTGTGRSFTLNTSMAPLNPFKDQLTIMSNLRLSGPEEDGHPNGSMRLLTGKTNGKSISLDQELADVFREESPFSHIHLGVQSQKLVTNQHDIMITRYAGGVEKTPKDNPIAAHKSLFDGTVTPGVVDDTQLAILDALKADLAELQNIAGRDDQQKLIQHAKAIDEVTKRATAASCSQNAVPAFDESRVNDDSAIPQITRIQMDNMVNAMACGLSRVGTLQLSHHTGDHVMDWDYLAGTNDQSSHAASHNSKTIHANQVRWYMDQVAYLLSELQSRPDPVKQGTMLDNSMVVVLSEIADGATHKKRPMPFFIAGSGSGAINTGQVLDCKNVAHSNMLIGIANAMGHPISRFGDDSTGALSGLLT